MKDAMYVYYDNHLRASASLTASPLASGYTPGDLYHPFLARDVLFTGNTATITATWGAGNYLDAVALCAAAFSQAQITIKNSAGTTVFTGTLNYSGPVTVFRLPQAIQTSSLQIIVYAAAPVDIGYLFAGLRTEFPRFIVKPSSGLAVTGKAESTDNGQVYGLKRPVLRTLSVAWENIDDDTRRRMEEYISAVQFVEPHIIEPYDTPEFPPLYGALTEGGSFPKRDRPGFWYDTNMSWTEAR
jgi:hypothetical protein